MRPKISIRKSISIRKCVSMLLKLPLGLTSIRDSLPKGYSTIKGNLHFNGRKNWSRLSKCFHRRGHSWLEGIILG